MKPGDRVQVIASDNEYVGMQGTISGVTTDGQVVVDLEVHTVSIWPIPFQPHDIEMADRVEAQGG